MFREIAKSLAKRSRFSITVSCRTPPRTAQEAGLFSRALLARPQEGEAWLAIEGVFWRLVRTERSNRVKTVVFLGLDSYACTNGRLLEEDLRNFLR